jgi:hypothetical protein
MELAFAPSSKRARVVAEDAAIDPADRGKVGVPHAAPRRRQCLARVEPLRSHLQREIHRVKLWASFRPLIGISTQKVGPTCGSSAGPTL